MPDDRARADAPQMVAELSALLESWYDRGVEPSLVATVITTYGAKLCAIVGIAAETHAEIAARVYHAAESRKEGTPDA